MHIIDHTPADTHNSFSEKYGKLPSMVHKFFVESLQKNRNAKLAAKIRKCSTHLLTVPWRTLLNQTERGLYLMRHMETFLGDSQKDWECGLSATGAKAYKSLGMLRVKYMRTLLTCDHNSRGSINQTHATRHWKERPAKFNFAQWFENYGLE